MLGIGIFSECFGRGQKIPLLLIFDFNSFVKIVFSFPGGKVDDNDSSPTYTALRECEEELGIVPDKVEVWAELQGIPDRVNILKFANDIG